MPRKFFRKFLPHPHRRKEGDHSSRWGKLIHNPNLWHLNRHSVARGIAIGVFWSFTPLPFGHMVFATVIAIRVRANVGLAALFTWINNPLTIVPTFVLAYTIGRLLMRQAPMPDFEPTWAWIEANHHSVWAPFAVGSVVLSVTLGVLSYVISQEFWKWRVARRWKRRGVVARANETTLV